MKILFEYPNPLPVQNYGGTERRVFWLMKELVQLGHEVFLIGHPKSKVKSIGVNLIIKDKAPKRSFYRTSKHTLNRTHDKPIWINQIPKGIDIVHLFYTPSFTLDIPIVVTIDGNGQVGEKFHSNTIFVSKKHAELHGSSQYVYNGIDLDEYPYCEEERSSREKKWMQFLFLAKAKWKVKNLKDCVQACRTLQKDLHIAGGRSWSVSRFIHSHGIVGNKEKIKLLRNSDALLFPVKWNEPFGIAIIEAFAMGVPVIGSKFGSLQELIQPQVGILCSNYQDFFHAVAREENNFQSRTIRSYVENNFSSKKMALDYCSCYSKILSGEKLNSHAPQTISKISPEMLMKF